MSTPYDVLGLRRSVTHQEIKRAYRRAALATHPDTGGDPAHFREVQAAWQTIGDPARRAAYDQRTAPDFTSTAPPRPSNQPKPKSPNPNPKPASTSASQPDPDPDPDPPAAPTPTTRLRTRGWRLTLFAGAAVSGLATALLIGAIALPLGALAGLYLTVILGLLAMRTWRSPGLGEGTYRGLTRAAWALTTLLGALAILTVLTPTSPWPPLVWTLCAGIFAASLTMASPGDST